MKTRILSVVCFIIAFYGTTKSQCDPDEITPNDVSKAVVLIEIRPNNSNESTFFTGVLINNQNNDGKNLVLTTSFPYDATNCGDIYISNEHYFHWDNGEETRFAHKIGQTNHFVLLELLQEPPYEEITYLGVDDVQHPHNSDLITYYYDGTEDYKTKMLADSWVNISLEYGCDNNDNPWYEWSETSFLKAWGVLIPEWQEGSGNINSEFSSKGGPLISRNDHIVNGMYLTRLEESVCDKDSALIVSTDEFSSIDIYNSIGSNSIKINKCLNQITVDFPLDEEEIFRAKTVVGKSAINDVKVEFRAANWALMLPGFHSGNDFLATIAPCEDVITAISLTDTDIIESRSIKESIGSIKVSPNPTNDIISIECDETILYIIIYDSKGDIVHSLKNIKTEDKSTSVNIGLLLSGMYFVQIQTATNNYTKKIIKL